MPLRLSSFSEVFGKLVLIGTLLLIGYLVYARIVHNKGTVENIVDLWNKGIGLFKR